MHLLERPSLPTICVDDNNKYSSSLIEGTGRLNGNRTNNFLEK